MLNSSVLNIKSGTFKTTHFHTKVNKGVNLKIYHGLVLC